MAVSLVGTGTFIKSTINGTATTLTFSTGAAASGDIVVAAWCHTRPTLSSGTPVFSSAGTAYTLLDWIENGNLTTAVYYRILTSSEATVSSCATGSAQDSVELAAIVLRGIESTPTISFNSTTGTSSNPNSPSVTVAVPNSAVITIGTILANTTLTAPSGYGSAVSTGATDTRSNALGLAYLSTNNGLTDPSSWTGGASAAWVAFTVTVASTESLPFTWLDMGHFPAMVDAPMPMIGY